jgi:glycosyltransferase involved in cell wall biosynthesis
MAPFVGGAEVAAERLAIGLRDAGHEVFVVVGARGAVLDRLRQADLRCLYSPMYFTDKWHWWRYRAARNALRRLLWHERPDIVHSNDLPTHQIISDAARGLGVPRVCHHRFPFEGACIDWLNKYGAERHLFISQALQRELTANSARLAAGSRAVVYDGVPLPTPTEADRRQARARLGLPPDRAIVLFAGQIIERKGVADLLRAWSLVGTEATGRAELVLAGEDLAGGGEYRRAMERLAAELGCAARFVGFQPDVGAWQLAADVAVVPSWVEPLGLVVLEAMARGVPVIGCAVGGIPELIDPGQTGILIPPRSPEPLAAALRCLLADASLRQQLGAHGRQRCEERFSLAAHVRGVVREYDEVRPRQRAAGPA